MDFQFDQQTVNIIIRRHYAHLSDANMNHYTAVCRRLNVDPLMGSIIPRVGFDKKTKSQTMELITTIRLLRSLATRTGEYNGVTASLWADESLKWKRAWVGPDFPHVAAVGVYRKGREKPVTGVAPWKECAQYEGKRLARFWLQRPAHMLAKCAEAQALRKAFPDELGGLLLPGEASQGDGKKLPPEEQDDRPVVFELWRGFLVPAPAGAEPDGRVFLSETQAAHHLANTVDLVRGLHAKWLKNQATIPV